MVKRWIIVFEKCRCLPCAEMSGCINRIKKEHFCAGTFNIKWNRGKRRTLFRGNAFIREQRIGRLEKWHVLFFSFFNSRFMSLFICDVLGMGRRNAKYFNEACPLYGKCSREQQFCIFFTRRTHVITFVKWAIFCGICVKHRENFMHVEFYSTGEFDAKYQRGLTKRHCCYFVCD